MHATPSMLLLLSYVKIASMPPKNILRDSYWSIPFKKTKSLYYFTNVNAKIRAANYYAPDPVNECWIV